MSRVKYKELWKGPHRLRQYAGSAVVHVTLSEHRGTYITIGPLSAETAFKHVAQAWTKYLDAREHDEIETPATLRSCATLAEVNARRA